MTFKLKQEIISFIKLYDIDLSNLKNGLVNIISFARDNINEEIYESIHSTNIFQNKLLYSDYIRRISKNSIFGSSVIDKIKFIEDDFSSGNILGEESEDSKARTPTQSIDSYINTVFSEDKYINISKDILNFLGFEKVMQDYYNIELGRLISDIEAAISDDDEPFKQSKDIDESYTIYDEEDISKSTDEPIHIPLDSTILEQIKGFYYGLTDLSPKREGYPISFHLSRFNTRDGLKLYVATTEPQVSNTTTLNGKIICTYNGKPIINKAVDGSGDIRSESIEELIIKFADDKELSSDINIIPGFKSWTEQDLSSVSIDTKNLTKSLRNKELYDRKESTLRTRINFHLSRDTNIDSESYDYELNSLEVLKKLPSTINIVESLIDNDIENIKSKNTNYSVDTYFSNLFNYISTKLSAPLQKIGGEAFSDENYIKDNLILVTSSIDDITNSLIYRDIILEKIFKKNKNEFSSIKNLLYKEVFSKNESYKNIIKEIFYNSMFRIAIESEVYVAQTRKFINSGQSNDLRDSEIELQFNEFQKILGVTIIQKYVSYLYNNENKNLFNYMNSSININILRKNAYIKTTPQETYGYQIIKCPTCSKDIKYKAFANLIERRDEKLRELNRSMIDNKILEIPIYSFFTNDGILITTDLIKKSGYDWDGILNDISSGSMDKHIDGLRRRADVLRSLGAKEIPRNSKLHSINKKTTCPFKNNNYSDQDISDISCGLSLNIDESLISNDSVKPHYIQSTSDQNVSAEKVMNIISSVEPSKSELILKEFNKRRSGGAKFSSICFNCPCKIEFTENLKENIDSLKKASYIALPFVGYSSPNFSDPNLYYPPLNNNGIKDYTAAYIICGKTTSISSFVRDPRNKNSILDLFRKTLYLGGSNFSKLVETLLFLNIEFDDLLPFISDLIADESLSKYFGKTSISRLENIYKQSAINLNNQKYEDSEIFDLIKDLTLVCSNGHYFRVYDSIMFGSTHYSYMLPSSDYVKLYNELKFMIATDGSIDGCLNSSPSFLRGLTLLNSTLDPSQRRLDALTKDYSAMDIFEGKKYKFKDPISGSKFIYPGADSDSIIPAWGVSKNRRTGKYTKTSIDLEEISKNKFEKIYNVVQATNPLDKEGKSLYENLGSDNVFENNVDDLDESLSYDTDNFMIEKPDKLSTLDKIYFQSIFPLKNALKMAHDMYHMSVSPLISLNINSDPTHLELDKNGLSDEISNISNIVESLLKEIFPTDVDKSNNALKLFKSYYLDIIKYQDIRAMYIAGESVSPISVTNIKKYILYSIYYADQSKDLIDNAETLMKVTESAKNINSIFISKVKLIDPKLTNLMNPPNKDSLGYKLGESGLRTNEILTRVSLLSSALYIFKKASYIYNSYFKNTSPKYLDIDLGIDLSDISSILNVEDFNGLKLKMTDIDSIKEYCDTKFRSSILDATTPNKDVGFYLMINKENLDNLRYETLLLISRIETSSSVFFNSLDSEKHIEYIKNMILNNEKISEIYPDKKSLNKFKSYIDSLYKINPICQISLSPESKYFKQFSKDQGVSNPVRLLPLFGAYILKNKINEYPVYFIFSDNRQKYNIGVELLNVKDAKTNSGNLVLFHENGRPSNIHEVGSVQLKDDYVFKLGWRLGYLSPTNSENEFAKDISTYYHPYTFSKVFINGEESVDVPTLSSNVIGYVNNFLGIDTSIGLAFGSLNAKVGSARTYPPPDDEDSNVGFVIPIKYQDDKADISRDKGDASPLFGNNFVIRTYPADSEGNTIQALDVNISDLLMRQPIHKANELLKSISDTYKEIQKTELMDSSDEIRKIKEKLNVIKINERKINDIINRLDEGKVVEPIEINEHIPGYIITEKSQVTSPNARTKLRRPGDAANRIQTQNIDVKLALSNILERSSSYSKFLINIIKNIRENKDKYIATLKSKIISLFNEYRSLPYAVMVSRTSTAISPLKKMQDGINIESGFSPTSSTSFYIPMADYTTCYRLMNSPEFSIVRPSLVKDSDLMQAATEEVTKLLIKINSLEPLAHNIKEYIDKNNIKTSDLESDGKSLGEIIIKDLNLMANDFLDINIVSVKIFEYLKSKIYNITNIQQDEINNFREFIYNEYFKLMNNLFSIDYRFFNLNPRLFEVNENKIFEFIDSAENNSFTIESIGIPKISRPSKSSFNSYAEYNNFYDNIFSKCKDRYIGFSTAAGQVYPVVDGDIHTFTELYTSLDKSGKVKIPREISDNDSNVLLTQENFETASSFFGKTVISETYLSTLQKSQGNEGQVLLKSHPSIFLRRSALKSTTPNKSVDYNEFMDKLKKHYEIVTRDTSKRTGVVGINHYMRGISEIFIDQIIDSANLARLYAINPEFFTREIVKKISQHHMQNKFISKVAMDLDKMSDKNLVASRMWADTMRGVRMASLLTMMIGR